MKRLILFIGITVALAVTATAAAETIYRPASPVTTQYIHHDIVPASSTADEYFLWDSAGLHLRYGGGTSIQGGWGNKRLVIHAEVLGQDGKTWYEIRGSRFVAGWTGWASTPLRAYHTRPAVLGHVYRTIVTATDYAPYPRGYVNLIYITSKTKGWAS